MVSIRLPGMNCERSLELPQWIPDQSDAEIRRITDLKTLESLHNQLCRRMEMLVDSNQQLRDFVMEEKALWEVREQEKVSTLCDASGTAGALLGDGSLGGMYQGMTEEDMEAVKEIVARDAARSETGAATSAGSEKGDTAVSSREEPDGTAMSVDSEGPGTVARSVSPAQTVEESPTHSDRSGSGGLAPAAAPSSRSAGPQLGALTSELARELLTDGRDAGQRYASSEEHYEMVAAIFENSHILDQMKVRVELLNCRIERMTMSQGMTL